MLVKVKWVIKVGAHCYVVVWRCQQVIIWQLSSKNLDLGQLFQILCHCTLLVVRSVVQFNGSCINLDWTMDQAVGPWMCTKLASAVECQSLLSINTLLTPRFTLDHHIDQDSISILITTQSTLHQHLSQQSHKSQLILLKIPCINVFPICCL